MLDIVEIPVDGRDLGIADSIVPKAANILSTQVGRLDFEPDFGVELKYFLESQFQIQNESLKNYFVERLSSYQVNVSDVLETLEALFGQYTFFVEDISDNNGGMIL